MKTAIIILTVSVASLLSLGMVMLYSSGMSGVGSGFMVSQLTSCVLGLTGCVIAACIDYRSLKKFGWLFLAAAVILLAVIWIPGLGVEVKGAKRWVEAGGMRLQTSELAKVAVVIFLAWYAEKYQRQMPQWKRGILIPTLIILPVLALIFIQPDRGGTIFLGGIWGLMLLISGARLRYLFPPVILGIGALAVSLYLDPMRSERITSWMNVEETRSGKGMQAYQSMIAFGSGGWTGLGLGNGRQKFGKLPEHHTDFILPIVGEELGFAATSLVIGGFLAILWAGIFIALRATDTFGLLLASGITFLISLQAFINIGVVTSALPNKGLPLPFISYGGSNLITLLTAVGILLSIARRAPSNEYEQLGRSSADDKDRNPFRAANNAA